MAISSNIAKTPDSLLYNFDVRWVKKLNQDMNSSFFDKNLNMIWFSTGDISQAPGSLELKFGEIGSAQELDKSWN